ncbi:hypothetical protein Goe5_c01630 [Bacillus phage vB_BthM-Goe5]|nr:hypothetical protein Goe5_c01630 [Bacillus phage vB_BthM-Goe5]
MTWDIYTKEGKWLGHCDNLETKEHMEMFRDCECRERTVEDEIVNMMSPWDMSGNEGDISWSVVPTDSYHMEIIKDLEGMNIED